MYIALYGGGGCCCCCYCVMLLLICNCGCTMTDKKQQHVTVTTHSNLHCEEIQYTAIYINCSVFKSSYCEEKQCVGHANIEADGSPTNQTYNYTAQLHQCIEECT